MLRGNRIVYLSFRYSHCLIVSVVLGSIVDSCDYIQNTGGSSGVLKTQLSQNIFFQAHIFYIEIIFCVCALLAVEVYQIYKLQNIAVGKYNSVF